MDRKDFLKSLAVAPLLSLSLRSKSENFGVLACRTQSDAEGPFYKANSPERNIIKAEGSPLRIEGKVLRADDCKTPVAKAVIEIWHCDNNGDYDMQGFNCRANFQSGLDGKFDFSTILPPSYGSRPRHIHFKIKAEGFPALTTQLYFEGDPNIKNDFARRAEKDRVISLVKEGNLQKGSFNIFL